MIVREVENPVLRDLFLLCKPSLVPYSNGPDFPFTDLRFVGSGKGAMSLVLSYLRRKGILADKLDEVLVPDWLGSWVYNQIQEFAFPVKRPSKRTKAILLYHQYGFPQDMDSIMAFARDNNLVVIEDCAHTISGSYKGRPLGWFGDFSIYSLSKFVFCFALGGVRSRDIDFNKYLDEVVPKSHFWMQILKDSCKLAHEIALSYEALRQIEVFTAATSMAYALYGRSLRPGSYACKLVCAKIEKEILVRQERYEYFRCESDFLGVCDHLPKAGVVPYVIPVRVPLHRESVLLQNLRGIDVFSGRYQFDVNRNCLCPKFEPTIWIPCHGQISAHKFQEVTRIVIETLK